MTTRLLLILVALAGVVVGRPPLHEDAANPCVALESRIFYLNEARNPPQALSDPYGRLGWPILTRTILQLSNGSMMTAKVQEVWPNVPPPLS